jgi:hypothetical protein
LKEAIMRVLPFINVWQRRFLRGRSRCTARPHFWHREKEATTYCVPLMLLVAFAAGCTTTGTGFGSTATGASPTTFSWKSSDVVSGTMTATLSDGTKYSGRYFQITRDTHGPSIAPLFDGWNSGWDETNWDAGASEEFMANLERRVVANLASPRGSHMRCNFQLVYPLNGMYGGGSGQCELPNGKTIDAKFPPG